MKFFIWGTQMKLGKHKRNGKGSKIKINKNGKWKLETKTNFDTGIYCAQNIKMTMYEYSLNSSKKKCDFF